MSYDKDIEKHPELASESKQSPVVEEGSVIPGESFEIGDIFYAKLQRLAGKYNIEQRGIERVPESERTDDKHPYLNAGTMVNISQNRIFGTDAKLAFSGSLLTWSLQPLLLAC